MANTQIPAPQADANASSPMRRGAIMMADVFAGAVIAAGRSRDVVAPLGANSSLGALRSLAP
jgi:hypothetical protein